ncbi:MAG TPA: hypothetical protein VK427_15230 [Kofleriaceae bacterium]|nr:hypothetical protein [Kofleriaceae bacterium]
MKFPQILAFALAVAGCRKDGPTQTTLAGRQLGESTASPGANASRPRPVTPDDPRVMNVSASVTPSQQSNALKAPLPQPAAPRDQATSSTPVSQPGDIAPASTTTEARPNVSSPPPPSATPAPAAPPPNPQTPPTQ